MGVIARRNTWSAARSRAMEVGERWRSNSKVNSIDDGKRIDVETFCDAFSRSTKLRKIVEEDENFADVDGSSFDCGDIVRLIQLASGEPRAVKAAKMLVGFSRNQQTVIQALENQNRALRDSYGVRLDNERTRKELNRLVHCTLQVSYNKLSALLAVAQGETKASMAVSTQKLYNSMTEVLALAEKSLVGDGLGAKAHLSSPEVSHLQQGCENLASLNMLCDQDLLCPKSACTEKSPLLPSGRKGSNLWRSLKKPWKSLAKGVKACFKPSAEKEAQNLQAENAAFSAHLRDCKDLLKSVKGWLLHWESVEFAFEADGGECVERESSNSQSTLKTLQTLLRKSELTTMDAVHKLLSNCGAMGEEIERQQLVEMDLVQKLNEMNLRLLNSENKACAVAMEMIMMGGVAM